MREYKTSSLELANTILNRCEPNIIKLKLQISTVHAARLWSQTCLEYYIRSHDKDYIRSARGQKARITSQSSFRAIIARRRVVNSSKHQEPSNRLSKNIFASQDAILIVITLPRGRKRSQRSSGAVQYARDILDEKFRHESMRWTFVRSTIWGYNVYMCLSTI